MSILIKGTNTEDLLRAMLMFRGHEIIELGDHGDLIDRDALFDANSWDWFNEWGSTVNKQAQFVVEAPVIIPEERSEYECTD